MSRFGQSFPSASLGVSVVLAVFIGSVSVQVQAAERPNILWITCEDISPNLGCYGDTYAVTPNLDRLAAQSTRYTRAFAPIGVCAPSRSSLITGVYACSLGSQHMRCQALIPPEIKCFPEYLRGAGYYCTNNSKTDYNFPVPPNAWDKNSAKAHWRGRKPGQPFFAVFNFTSCHESQIRLPEAQYQERIASFQPGEVHDPAKAPLPPYHPDTPESRQDWARYADAITYMDKQAGEILKQLEADGLAENTIVFYFSDHGAGMPRSKRWLYDSSTRVPLLIRTPAALRDLTGGEPGTTSDRLVNLLDFAPSVLSLCDVEIPKHLQGVAFLGPKAGAPRTHVFGFRDRMDERYDMIRMARDTRYKYIRNYYPQLPWFHDQFLSYAWEMPTLKAWQGLAEQGKLSGPQAIFMAPRKPMEELYDTEADPWETVNLATDPAHQDTLRRLRESLRKWQLEIVDLGLMPEADLRSRFGDEPPYAAVRRDPSSYPIERIMAAADTANELNPANIEKLKSLLSDSDPAVRYWAATGLGALGEAGREAIEPLKAATRDAAPAVRVAAGDALCRAGNDDAGLPALAAGLRDENSWARLQAINSVDRWLPRARSLEPQVRAALTDSNEYVVRVAKHAAERLQSEK